jgi:uncharacterized phage infection (PIP) family protein YhgE
MSSELPGFDAALGKMGNGIRRAHQGFDEADAGFIEALEALKAITLAKGTIEERFDEMRDTIARLETELLAQGKELRAMRERLK